MSKLPQSFDPFLLRDELVATLKQSPLTSQFVPLRAEQIIELIVQKPICMMLQQQIKTLQLKLQEQKTNKRTLRTESKRDRMVRQLESRQTQDAIKRQEQQLQQYIDKIGLLEEANDQLEGELQQLEVVAREYEHKEKQIQHEKMKISEQLERVMSQNEAMRGQLKDRDKTIAQILQKQQNLDKDNRQTVQSMQSKLKASEQNMEKQMKSQLTVLEEVKSQHEGFILQKDKQIEALKEQRFNLKNELNSCKIDLEESLKEIDTLKTEKSDLIAEKERLKEIVKTNKIVFEKQKKMINNRLHELSVTYKAHQKLKGNLKNLFKTVKNVKDEQTKCSSWVKEQLRAIGGEVQEKTRGMLDEVGKQVELEVKALGERLQNKRQEARGAKNEVKYKEQALQRLEKQLSASNREISDLKTELRSKKRDQERLRRELKTNYEDSEAKLNILQKKYLDVLGTSSY